MSGTILLVMAVCLVIPYLPLHAKFNALAGLAFPFAIGTGFHVWRNSLPLSPLLAVLLAIATFLARGTVAFQPVFDLSLAYAAFVFGYWPSEALQRYNRLGDYSYGTYVYAFPVQRVGAGLGITGPLTNIAFAFPLTLGCAVASWHLVERPALKLKPTARSGGSSAIEALGK